MDKSRENGRVRVDNGRVLDLDDEARALKIPGQLRFEVSNVYMREVVKMGWGICLIDPDTSALVPW
jgi:hypothetical protein